VTPGTHDLIAADWLAFRERTTTGRSADAVELADRIIAESQDPLRIAQAMIEKLVALLNMGEFRRLRPLMDQIHAALRQSPDYRLTGEFHAVAGVVAFENGSLSAAMMDLVRAERSLRRMTEQNIAAMDAWHDLSVAYSLCGFHAKAMEAQREAARVSAAAGLSPALAVLIEAQVRTAVGLDQRGDTAGCVRHLQSIVAAARPLAEELEVGDRIYLRYAMQRLGALGHPEPLTMPQEPVGDLILADVIRLGDICVALAESNPALALSLIDEAPRAIDVLGTAEPLRLRSLARSAAGDDTGALAIEREILRVVMAEDRQLRELLTDSISARLDQDRLQKVAARYAGEAYTDPLTGLPNRRRTAEVARGLAESGKRAMLGILDLDGFKAVNDKHGHPSGDLVLQRVAGIFARAARPGDLLARQGGDEFVMILPETSALDAAEIGARVSAAISAEDWSALVPGTPVSVSIGWAMFDGDLNAALKTADDALYRLKRPGRWPTQVDPPPPADPPTAIDPAPAVDPLAPRRSWT
jgi:diguanylate cyclase (GGDEF)-like protein